MQNGVLLRTEVDSITGRLSEQRMRFLGTSAPTLLPVRASGMPAMMALSTSPWLGHVYHGKFQLVPLAYDPMDYVAPFCSEKVRMACVYLAQLHCCCVCMLMPNIGLCVDAVRFYVGLRALPIRANLIQGICSCYVLSALSCDTLLGRHVEQEAILEVVLEKASSRFIVDTSLHHPRDSIVLEAEGTSFYSPTDGLVYRNASFLCSTFHKQSL
jgi:hypothetical protein